MSPLMRIFFHRAKTLIAFAAPIAGARFISMLASFFPMLFVAGLGKRELAAAAIAIATLIPILVMGRTFFNATGILISHHQQQDDAESIAALMQNSLGLCLLLSVILALLLWHITPILLLLGQKPELVKLSSGFFYYAGWNTFPVMLSTYIIQYYIGTGRPRVALYLSLGMTPITIILAYALILGRWGFPQMGLSGFSLAQLITQGSGFVVIVLIWLLADNKRRGGLFTTKPFFSLSICKKIACLGFPISVQTSAEIIAIAITTYFMGWLGADALAAAQIVNQYVVLFVMLYIGLSQAISIVTSKAHAQNNYQIIKEYTLTAIGLMTILFVFVAIIFIVFPTPLTDLFLDTGHIQHGNIIALAKVFFMIAIITNYADSIRYVLAGAYRGMKNSKKPMLVGIFSFWVIGVGVSYLLGIQLNFGPVGIRYGITVGIVCATLYLVYDFYQHQLMKPLKR